MEAIDVLANEYEFFDSVGRRIKATARDESAPVEFEPTTEVVADVLIERLHDLVEHVGIDRAGIKNLRKSDLRDLIKGPSNFFEV